MSQVISDRLESLLWHFPVSAHLKALDFETEGCVRFFILSDQAASMFSSEREDKSPVGSRIILTKNLSFDSLNGCCSSFLMQSFLYFQGGDINPLLNALPATLELSVSSINGAEALVELLVAEIEDSRCGRSALVQRLTESLFIKTFREIVENGVVKSGLLAGMAHPQLRHALVAMHDTPTHDWTLDSLAKKSGLSKASFLQVFRQTLGMTPADYLQAWRVSLAQKALKSGKQLKQICGEVGYGSEQALSRAFKSRCGVSPILWRSLQAA